jgi:FixJ family two-component response regulator
VSTASGTVFIVDDDRLIHRALTRLLSAVGYDVRTFLCAEDFLREPGVAGPGCLLLDVTMPGMRGLDLQRALAASERRYPIVFLTGHGDVQTCADAMKKGAVDFLTKPIDDTKLFDAIERALCLDRGECTQRAARHTVEQRAGTLTRRERQVMALVVAGLLNKQIAANLGASQSTIKIHRARVMTKMHAGSIAELVYLASQLEGGMSRPTFAAAVDAA